MPVTIDIDTGGTFTDVFVVRDGTVHTAKTLTTPHDLALCFRAAVQAAAERLGTGVAEMLRDTVAVRYATTVGTNTVIQRNGPRLGLLTDDDRIATGGPATGVGTFVDRGMVARVPDGESGLAETRGLLHDGARGLVLAAEDTERESALAGTFREHHPRHCLDAVPLLRAGELATGPDPVRAAATALFNAYLHPDVADYLYRAEDYLRDQGYDRPLRVVHNDGGAARVARTVAARTYNSGPAAGLLGAAAVARHRGIENLVTLDMGGTSLDVGVLCSAAVPVLEHGVVAGVEIDLPLPDLLPFGLGGGSIAWLDGTELRVGPRSAGASPGPACFGFGGAEPTVTDADAVLGVLRPETFLGGGMELDVTAARRVFTPIADRLGITVEDLAGRVLETAHRDAGHGVAAELRRRGVEPSSATALAFGGNGATHGAGIAAAAGIGEVLVLPFGAVFSAYGASTVDVRHTRQVPEGTVEESVLRDRVLRDMHGEGVGPEDVELTVTTVDRDGGRWLVVQGVHRLPHHPPTGPRLPAATGRATSSRPVHWPGLGLLDTAVLDRDELAGGPAVPGPALIDSADTTLTVPPGWTLTVDDHGAARLGASNEGSGR
ncbi:MULTISPECIES: hydantoinase/oxoprolinase family protein [Pseudonocardia]|uniref:Acetophenone carboxylase gamma subunit n=2 Tax=Pseudonocardia TaxID=1847 RepID=A0A1Y2N6V5_PSEAH|nr:MULTISPECIES: hydantoinase/oxoprolinase family protein [Pseudonocardia]OSY43200.1 Acetophenone carboxylase gamma subunit [Pseudonocardia autotrophica]TDN71688.1 N-methylhydantoinase A/oxoprolinase/acetone carboxylase beta subunit [Pseudonocardia autotrophica]BBG02375.1 5-oxoprolinase [Pseudonocardia autotrophica]GEC23289.1 5-oxoprolinase [Pseudonocardia saturnea]